MTRTVHSLIPLNVGECTLGLRHVLGDDYSDDDRMPFTLYAFLIVTPDKRYVLVDLGPVGLEFLNAMFRRYDFFRPLPGDPDAIRQPHGNVFDHLDRLGVRPSQIEHVILTHMHADHHGLIDGKDGGAIERFPNAVLHVSKIGWHDNLAKRTNGQWNSYVDFAFADYILAGARTGRAVIHDDYTLLDGIDVFYVGGHSICSQVVTVRTACGPALIVGDEIYHYDLAAKGVMARLHTTPDRLIASTNTLMRRADSGNGVLLPCHDPLLSLWYYEHGPKWLDFARLRTRETCAAYHGLGHVQVLSTRGDRQL